MKIIQDCETSVKWTLFVLSFFCLLFRNILSFLLEIGANGAS